MDSSSSSRRRNGLAGGSSSVVQGCGEPARSKLSDLEYSKAEVLVRKKGTGSAWEGSERKPTKLLLNVNIQNGLGPVHVLMSPENTVGDLIKAVMDVYVKEKRRPLLPSTEPHFFELHYSQFSLEGLKTEEKLENLGSRNFFVCPKPGNSSSHFDQAKTMAKSPFPLTKIMNYLL